MALLNLTYVSIAFWLKGSKAKQQMNISFNREAKGGSRSSQGMGRGESCVCGCSRVAPVPFSEVV